ncbi:MAG: hypothetical protein ACU83U_15620, partial [Gammaproteobacteria bacterium]
ETVEQLSFLREKGCDRYQGYIKSKPIPAHELAELLLNQQAISKKNERQSVSSYTNNLVTKI